MQKSYWYEKLRKKGKKIESLQRKNAVVSA